MIRPAKEPDLAFIQSLISRCEGCGFSKEALIRYANRGQLFIISNEMAPSGFLIEQVVLDEAELLQVVIDPSQQGRGIATTNLAEWHQSLLSRGVSQVFLEVRDGNSTAISLYRRLGYTDSGIRKNYYHIAGQKYDALLMRRDLF